MEKKHINTIITHFFANDFPKETRKRFGNWFLREKQIEEKEEAMEDIWNSLPETIQLESYLELNKVNDIIRTKAYYLPYKRIVARVAVFLLPLTGFITALYINNEGAGREINMLECFVSNGEREQIILPDGSTVWLNAGSVLFYPELFADTRTIYLSGEGNFTVTEDETKPFIVKTKFIDIEALGTVFNVYSYPDEMKTITTLESGKVRVDDRSGVSASFILQPNDQLIYNHTDASFTKKVIDATRLNSWTEGYLVFQQEPLETIFRSLERIHNVKINYNNHIVGTMTFTVRFHSDDTLEESLKILKQIGSNFTYKITGNDVYIQ